MGTRRSYLDSDSDDNYPYCISVNIPDRSKSDYYCEICDSHMNNIQMWESHINGKRHLKNIKKEPGELPTKVRTRVIDAPPEALNLLNEVNFPVVGLDYITETQRLMPGLHSSYSCYLCQGTFPYSGFIEHIKSTKHRLNYIQEADAGAYNVLNKLDLSEASFDNLVEDRAKEYQEKRGSGRIEVKLEKTKSSGYRPFNIHNKPSDMLRGRSTPKTNQNRDKSTESSSAKSGRSIPQRSRSSSSSSSSSSSEEEMNIPECAGATASVAEVTELPADFDLPKHFKNLPHELMVDVIKKTATAPNITCEEDEKAVLHLINKLSAITMELRLRNLPKDIREKLIVDFKATIPTTVEDALDLQNNMLDCNEEELNGQCPILQYGVDIKNEEEASGSR